MPEPDSPDVHSTSGKDAPGSAAAPTASGAPLRRAGDDNAFPQPGLEGDALILAAREAARNSDAPYSRFPVGAAVEAADGRVFRGCNVESASYGLSVCAERTAIFSAIAAGAVPRRIAVTCVEGNPSRPNTLMPCGACRQIMMDKMGPEGRVLVDGVGEFSVDDLLPLGFALEG